MFPRDLQYNLSEGLHWRCIALALATENCMLTCHTATRPQLKSHADSSRPLSCLLFHLFTVLLLASSLPASLSLSLLSTHIAHTLLLHTRSVRLTLPRTQSAITSHYFPSSGFPSPQQPDSLSLSPCLHLSACFTCRVLTPHVLTFPASLIISLFQ